MKVVFFILMVVIAASIAAAVYFFYGANVSLPQLENRGIQITAPEIEYDFPNVPTAPEGAKG